MDSNLAVDDDDEKKTFRQERSRQRRATRRSVATTADDEHQLGSSQNSPRRSARSEKAAIGSVRIDDTLPDVENQARASSSSTHNSPKRSTRHSTRRSTRSEKASMFAPPPITEKVSHRSHRQPESENYDKATTMFFLILAPWRFQDPLGSVS